MKINEETAKPLQVQEVTDVEPENLVGDVIGDTVYSQRFVLKILLKFANLDTYKDEVNNEDFETDMCTLWDMTTERDVVKFLLDHDFYNLLHFVLPTTSNPRIIEILIGITGNLCCTVSSVARLMDNEDLCLTLLAFSQTDDSLILVQIMRFINSCLVNNKDDDLQLCWLKMFRESELPNALSFIMTYSANKHVLMSTLETLHCICSSCNIVTLEHVFFELFVQENLVDSLIVAFWELRKLNKTESFDTLNSYFTMYLYVTVTLAGFNKSITTYSNHFSVTLSTLIDVLMHYTGKAKRGHLDDTLVDVVELTTIICSSLCLYSEQSMRQLLHYMFTLWEYSCPDSNPDHIGHSNNLTIKLNEHVSIFFAKYIDSVTDEALRLEINGDIKKNIIGIVSSIKYHNLTCINMNELEMRVNSFYSSDDN